MIDGWSIDKQIYVARMLKVKQDFDRVNKLSTNFSMKLLGNSSSNLEILLLLESFLQKAQSVIDTDPELAQSPAVKQPLLGKHKTTYFIYLYNME